MIATLQDLSSLYVDFYLPEQFVPKLAVGQPVQLSVAAYGQEVFPGRLSAINPKVDEATRNVLVRATLANPDGKLLPGMFANLQVLLPDPQAQVVIPESAVTYTLYGNSVYVVAEKKAEDGTLLKEPDGRPQLMAERRFIKTAERRDGLVKVIEGLKDGEQVVSGGQLKLDNGAHIAISPDKMAPAATPAPPAN